MDANQCRVLYIDDRFPSERWLSRNSTASGYDSNLSNRGALLPVELQTNVDAILQVFSQVYVCNTGRAFSTKLAEFSETIGDDYSPVLALFDIAPELRHDMSLPRGRRASTDDFGPIPHALHRSFTFTSESDESYGLQLLSRIASDLQVADYGKLIIPIAITRSKNGTDSLLETHNEEGNSSNNEQDDFLKPNDRTLSAGSRPLSVISAQKRLGTRDSQDAQLLLKCLDAGAVDVVIDHLDQTRVLSLVGLVYKAWKATKKASASFLSKKKTRRQSWVGMDDEKPYAYLRESMVRKLMNRICDPEAHVEDTQFPALKIEDDRKSEIAEAVGRWDFCAHNFSEEELVYGAGCMLNHALEMAEASKWFLSFDELITFAQAARSAYNSFVIYHNFHHAIDVLQACFFFLIQIGALPLYPRGEESEEYRLPRAPLAGLVKPFEALTLLISAIGHDVGHPGVNNLFLVKLNAPLAQLYNDKSVLEAFHCAAFSQILRQHWPAAFEDKELRSLLISNILATDMGIHSDYMQQMGDLQSKIGETKTTDGWAPKDLEHSRILVCGLLIKCADISNIARPWAVAKKWTNLLQDEFHNQGEMEKAVGMDSCLFGGPPELGNLEKLAHGQMGFMGFFGLPLFGGVADFLPGMSFGEQTIQSNKKAWFNIAEQEKLRKTMISKAPPVDSLVSPRSQSPRTIRRKHASDTMTEEPSSYFPSSLQNATDRSSSVEPPSTKAEGPATTAMKDPGHNLSPSEVRAASERFAQMLDSSGGRPGPLKPRKSSQAIPSGHFNIRGTYDGGSTPPKNPGMLEASKDQRKVRPKSSPANPETPTDVALDADSQWARDLSPPIKLSLPQRASMQRVPVAEETSQPVRRQQQSSNFTGDKCSKHTTSSVMTPTSTQATSFFTEGSENGRALEGTRGDTATTETTASSSGLDSERLDLGNPIVPEKPEKKTTKSSKKEKKPKKGSQPVNADPHEESEAAHVGARLVPPPIPDDALSSEHSPLPRKKSRIRLAFWRKNKSNDGKSPENKYPEPKHMHGEDVEAAKERPDSGVDHI